MLRLSTAVLLISLAGLLAACGGPSNEISVTTTDFHFNPQNWTVPAGETITVTLVNNGTLEHEWVLLKQGESATAPFNDDDEAKVLWEIEAKAGETTTGTFTAPAAGNYEVVCGVVGHLEQGMAGSLLVK